MASRFRPPNAAARCGAAGVGEAVGVADGVGDNEGEAVGVADSVGDGSTLASTAASFGRTLGDASTSELVLAADATPVLAPFAEASPGAAATRIDIESSEPKRTSAPIGGLREDPATGTAVADGGCVRITGHTSRGIPPDSNWCAQGGAEGPLRRGGEEWNPGQLRSTLRPAAAHDHWSLVRRSRVGRTAEVYARLSASNRPRLPTPTSRAPWRSTLVRTVRDVRAGERVPRRRRR